MTAEQISTHIAAIATMLADMPKDNKWRQARLKAMWLRSELEYWLRQTTNHSEQ